METLSAKIETLQKRIQSVSRKLRDIYEIEDHAIELRQKNEITPYDILNSKRVSGFTRNNVKILPSNCPKFSPGEHNTDVLKKRHDVAYQIARDERDGEIAAQIQEILVEAKSLLETQQSERLYADWIKSKKKKKFFFEPEPDPRPKPEPKKKVDEYFSEWGDLPDKPPSKKDEPKAKKIQKWHYEALWKYSLNWWYTLDSRKKWLAASACGIITAFIFWLLQPPSPPPLPPVDPEIEQKINAKMEELFRRCNDGTEILKRYTRYEGKLYKIGNLAWQIISEPVSAIDKNYNNYRFQGKIYLIQNPKQLNIPVGYHVYDAKTKRWSDRAEQLFQAGNNCSPLPCVLSVTVKKDELIISPKYEPTVTKCDSIQTPANPLEDDYLTLEDLAEHRKGEIDKITEALTNRFRGNCGEDFYIANYEPPSEEDTAAKRTCFVQATDLRWEVDKGWEPKTVKSLIGTASGLTKYCKSGQNNNYERVEISSEENLGTAEVRFRDGEWQQPEKVSWEAFPCVDAKRIIRQIQADEERFAREEQEAQKRAEAEREQARIESEKKELQRLKDESLPYLIMQCDGYHYIFRQVFNRSGYVEELFRIKDDSQRVKIDSQKNLSELEVAVQVQPGVPCEVLGRVNFKPSSRQSCIRFPGTLVKVNMRSLGSGRWSAAPNDNWLYSVPGCKKVSEILQQYIEQQRLRRIE